jgi:DNA-binding MurR/RpiR family transcriptional regulator
MNRKIEEAYPNLSKSDKKIADYFLKHEDDVLSLNIHELSARIGTSSSTMSRFVRKVFGKNFAQVKIELAKTVRERGLEESSQILEWAVHLDELPEKIMGAIDRSLLEVQQANSIEAIAKAIEMLANASTIYLFGVGNSGVVVQDLMQKLIKLKKRAVYLHDSNFSVLSSLLAGPDDVVFAVSNSGHSKEVLTAVKKAKSAGAKVIALTSDSNSPLAGLSDLMLISPATERNASRLSAMFSRHGQLYIVDMLFVGVAQSLSHTPEAFLKDYQELLAGLKDEVQEGI